MSKSNIHQLRLIVQDSKEGIFTVTGIALTNLLHDLIREYGTYNDGTIYIDSNSFTNTEKKLLLSYLVGSDEYEYACTKSVRLEALYGEYKHHIQELLDEECDVVYREIMEDSEMRPYNHKDNNEVYWRMR